MSNPLGLVEWQPFCSNPACLCAEPDRTVCDHFERLHPGHENRRCLRCGWPARHHQAGWARIDRSPRDPRDDDPNEPCNWRWTCWLCGDVVWHPTAASAHQAWRRHAKRDHAPMLEVTP